jgi:hypothetical protein
MAIVSVPAVVAALIAAFAAIRRRWGQDCTVPRSGAAEASRRRAGWRLFCFAMQRMPRGTRAPSRGTEASGGKQLPTALAGLEQLTPTRPLEGHGCGLFHSMGQAWPFVRLLYDPLPGPFAHALHGRHLATSCGTS